MDLAHSSQHTKGTAIPCYDDVAPSFMYGASLERRKPCYLGTSKLIDHVLFSTRRSKDKTAQQTRYHVYTLHVTATVYTLYGGRGGRAFPVAVYALPLHKYFAGVKFVDAQ